MPLLIMKKNHIVSIFTLLFVLFSLGLSSCSDKGKEGAKSAPAPVTTQIARQDSIEHTIQAVGNVYPSASVDIVPRVTGEILSVDFTEGQDVQAGQPLIQIDPRPYETGLREKKGALAKSQAQLNKARKDQSRYAQLVNNGFVSRDSYEKAATDASSLQATVQADSAAVENAALELSYCKVTAPINGRIGALKVHKGNMIKTANSDPIVTIDTIEPCYVTFSVPEVHLPVILDQMKSGTVKITATPLGGNPEEGVLQLVDNNVDTKTGTIRLRGIFNNKNRHLWPGQFVEVQLPLGIAENALILPSKAVQTGRNESFVYVVDKNGKAEYRKIKILFENNGQTVTQSNINPGDQIIVDGQIRLTPGMPVKILNNKEK